MRRRGSRLEGKNLSSRSLLRAASPRSGLMPELDLTISLPSDHAVAVAGDRSKAWGKFLARVGSEGDQTPRHVRVISDEELEAEGYEVSD